ncbi:hypothetical protein SAMN05444008_1017 [Cnuella takakiae]|uniref:Uncharacterized protein n=1 Tax=Cnuella takakiae TaxID=1302690 RepID=A0A1M4S7Z7_9BACT|nr:hypothetical protein BUE76_22895 [Cnuella takakiae]SHE28333.1 hypothetical protein SAMN05444008_1017 [Cnuella takakiae]
MANITIQKNPKKPKGKMYECQAFFAETYPKKWKYVRDLESFSNFLRQSHPAYKYFNVYEKGSRQFLKRFYPGNLVPKVLPFWVFASLGLLTQKFTSSNTSSFSQVLQYPLKNTPGETTLTTSAYDFNYCATIPTFWKRKGGASC